MKKQQLFFKINDLIPNDVFEWSLLAGYFLLFPALFILFANSFNNLFGILSERLLLFFLFILIGGIGTKFCRKILMISMLVLFFLWDGIDLFCFLQLKTQIDPSFLALLKTTNPNECSGFLKHTLFKWSNLIILFYPLCGILCWKFGTKYRNWLLCGTLFCSILFVFISGIDSAHDGKALNLIDRIDDTLDSVAENGMKESLLELANSNLHVTAATGEMTMILVIGESHSKYHSSLYQYPRETNPLLKKRVQAETLTVFTDVVAPHSFTMYSVPKLLTLAGHHTQETHFELPNIFDLAKSAGFKTFWLCNHPARTDQNMAYAPITNRADIIVHTSSGTRQNTDDALLPEYQKALNDPAKRKLIVLQLIGSHHDYEATYPSNKGFFPLDSIPSHFNTEQRKNHKTVNAYDNSIRYNDAILDQMILKFEATGKLGFLLYLPDHGENLYEQPGMIMHMEFMPTLQSVEIPMYLHLSSDHPAKSAVRTAKDRPFSSEDLPYLLMDLGKLNYSGADMKKSLLSPEYQPGKRLVSNCRVDYEKLKKAGHGNLTNQNLK